MTSCTFDSLGVPSQCTPLRGIFDYAGFDKVDGVPMVDLLGRRHSWVGSDGQRHTGTVVGVFAWRGPTDRIPAGTPMVSIDITYNCCTYARAAEVI